MLVNQTRGLSIGHSFDDLTEVKDWSPSVLGGNSIPLISGQYQHIVNAGWTVEGQICIRQSYPLPATILSIVPDLIVGDTIQ